MEVHKTGCSRATRLVLHVQLIMIRKALLLIIVIIFQDALNLSRQQIQELMALRRIFLPKMGQLLKDRQRISRALQDSQVPFSPPSPGSLCLCLPSVGPRHDSLPFPLFWLHPLPTAFGCPPLAPCCPFAFASFICSNLTAWPSCILLAALLPNVCFCACFCLPSAFSCLLASVCLSVCGVRMTSAYIA